MSPNFWSDQRDVLDLDKDMGEDDILCMVVEHHECQLGLRLFRSMHHTEEATDRPELSRNNICPF